MNMGIQHEWGPFRKCTYYQYCTAKIAFLQGSFRPTCRKWGSPMKKVEENPLTKGGSLRIIKFVLRE